MHVPSTNVSWTRPIWVTPDCHTQSRYWTLDPLITWKSVCHFSLRLCIQNLCEIVVKYQVITEE